MPINWLTAADRDRLARFPSRIPETDLISFFTLTKEDRRFVKRHYGAGGQLGIALQLCALRFLGFIPGELDSAPEAAVEFLAHQLDVPSESLAEYGRRRHTRNDHAGEIESYLGFRSAGAAAWEMIESWLLDRAMEHDRPTLLLELLSERLRALKFIRPTVTRLERAVSRARQQARKETWRKFAPRLGKETRKKLDGLLEVDEKHGLTPLTRVRTGATSSSAGAILTALEKIVEMAQRERSCDKTQQQGLKSATSVPRDPDFFRFCD
jgi:Domain of unknown function (DUF4158)